MFGWFGKRAPGMSAGEMLQIIPQEAWDDDIGEALRSAGLAPDAPADVGPARPLAADPIDARIATEKLAHEAVLASINARIDATHPGCTVATQFILTDDIWNGEHAELLLHILELTPYGDFNTRLLPADEASARAMRQPARHLGQFGEVLGVANGHIREIARGHGLEDPAAADGASRQAKEAMKRDLAGLTDHYYEEYILPLLRENPYPA